MSQSPNPPAGRIAAAALEWVPVGEPADVAVAATLIALLADARMPEQPAPAGDAWTTWAWPPKSQAEELDCWLM